MKISVQQSQHLSGEKFSNASTEFQHCEALCQWLALNSREIPAFTRFFHVPNEGYRERNYAQKLKRIGVKAGVADYVWFLGPKGRCIFIEMKSHGGRKSIPQAHFEQQCRDAEAVYRTFYTWLEAAHFMALLLFEEKTITQNKYTELRNQLI